MPELPDVLARAHELRLLGNDADGAVYLQMGINEFAIGDKHCGPARQEVAPKRTAPTGSV